ncbi:hypothetical protein E2562_011002 [Oryza meyeriana var. granulata]|uniref:Peroxidase n=1 Tax=Oryza meyeriana var. granulata TaxID=110450 RepID=A0A6G1BWT0_9ORYZ|nr:hypothetical protein E2562_011002 [Oryza meyeriana var. granulata]
MDQMRRRRQRIVLCWVLATLPVSNAGCESTVSTGADASTTKGAIPNGEVAGAKGIVLSTASHSASPEASSAIREVAGAKAVVSTRGNAYPEDNDAGSARPKAIVSSCGDTVHKAVSETLSPNFYALSCPSVELAVRDVVRSASTLDSTIPGKLLRMLFHDCFVEGCDASVMIEGNGTERTDPANLSLGGFNVIDAAKRLLEVVCPATVSCSDILVLAARDAVTFTGGPSVPVSLGRRDGLVSLASNVRANIIDTGFSVDAMARSFSAKGLTLDDLVTLSGGHTIGSAHCTTFGERFRVDANGSTVPVDAAMNADYAGELIRTCSAVNGTVSSTAAVDCDEGSASRFDNAYFVNLLAGRGLLRTDAVLVQNATTRAAVEAFARSEESFFASWAASFARLTSLGVKTGADGEVRRLCSRVNG